MEATKLRTLRIPLGLDERLVRSAKWNERSWNGEVLTAIRLHLERQQQRADEEQR